jgi:hypothetical protein
MISVADCIWVFGVEETDLMEVRRQETSFKCNFHDFRTLTSLYLKKVKIESTPVCLLLKIKVKTPEPAALASQDQCPKSVFLPMCEVLTFPEGGKHFNTFSGLNIKVKKLFPSKERMSSSHECHAWSPS